MGNKKFILNADDFGVNNNINLGILDGYNNGFLTSASICANGKEFDVAVNEILPDCPNLGIGVHLNISNGNALCKHKLLSNNNHFNNTFLHIYKLSSNSEFLKEIETEFRAQIEKVNNYSTIDHLNSQSHIHSIPAIFKIVCKLANEYKISYVRLPKEEIILMPDMHKFINLTFPISISKVLIMNIFSKINQKTASDYNIKTNHFTNGELYRGFFDSKVIEECLSQYEDNTIIECVVIPDQYRRLSEYKISKDKILADKIYRAGFDLTNYKKLTNEK